MYDAEEVATGDEEVDMDEVRAKYVTYCSKYHQASSQGKSLHPLSASSPLPFFLPVFRSYPGLCGAAS